MDGILDAGSIPAYSIFESGEKKAKQRTAKNKTKLSAKSKTKGNKKGAVALIIMFFLTSFICFMMYFI